MGCGGSVNLNSGYPCHCKDDSGRRFVDSPKKVTQPSATPICVLGMPTSTAWVDSGAAAPCSPHSRHFLTQYNSSGFGLKGPSRMFADPHNFPWLPYAVSKFLPWQAKVGEMLRLSKNMNTFFDGGNPTSYYWQWLCTCLCEDAKLHMPLDVERFNLLVGSSGNCRALFYELWPLRRRFSDARFVVKSAAFEAPDPERFRLAAYCRMRPPVEVGSVDGTIANVETVAPNGSAVALPLYQRVALLQQKKPELSHSEALKEVLSKTAFKNCNNDTTMVAEAGNVGLVASVLSVTPGPGGSVLTVSPGIGIHSWDFSCVFGDAAPQREVFSQCGFRLAVDFVNGSSGALIVYGQTGSGKTHTMFGPPASLGLHPPSDDGLVSRIADEVLKGIEARRDAGFEVELGVSYVEVFGEDITDLLGTELGTNRGANQRMGHRYVLNGKCEEVVIDRAGFASILARGDKRKRKASTAMNEQSSRAHTIVIFRLTQRALGQETAHVSMLSLVDLGGSEKLSKSKANQNICTPGSVTAGEEIGRKTWKEYYKSRERVSETNNINKGLLTLKRCVQALNERARRQQEGKDLPRVPFFDSKLTMLLAPALDGGARTSVVVCCSQEQKHAEETVQSCRFGEMCSKVEHTEGDYCAKDTSAVVEQALKQIDAELKEVEAEIRKKERWEWRRTIRADVVDEKDNLVAVLNQDEVTELGGKGAVEIRGDDGTSRKQHVEHEVMGQVLVGAEAENARREDLLRRRARLLGED